MTRAVADPVLKARALRLAEEHGPAEAARRTGIEASKIRVWQTRARAAKRGLVTPAAVRSARSGRVSDPAEDVAGHVAVDVEGLDEFEARILPAAKRAVEKALARLEELIPQAKGVQSVAISAGILMDKVAVLNAAMADAEDRRARLSAESGQVISALLQQFVAACGLLPEDPVVRRVVGGLLKQASQSEVLVVSPADAAALHKLIVLSVRGQIEREVRAEMAGRESRPQLPAPVPEPTADDRLREWQDRHRAAPVEDDDGELVLDAEVVDRLVCRCSAGVRRFFSGVCVNCGGVPRGEA